MSQRPKSIFLNFLDTNILSELIHVHCRRGNKECKYWLDSETFDLEDAYSYNMTPRDSREIKKIIFDEDLSIDGLLGIVHHRKGKSIAA